MILSGVEVRLMDDLLLESAEAQVRLEAELLAFSISGLDVSKPHARLRMAQYIRHAVTAFSLVNFETDDPAHRIENAVQAAGRHFTGHLAKLFSDMASAIRVALLEEAIHTDDAKRAAAAPPRKKRVATVERHFDQTKGMRRAEAARYLGLAPKTLSKWALHGKGPRFARLGRRLVLYDIADLDAYMSSCPTGGDPPKKNTLTRAKHPATLQITPGAKG